MPTPFNSKYSSTEIENFFDLLNSNSFITNTVSNLVNYYLKSDTYSKSEVDSIINTVKNGRFQNVNSLPEQDIDTNVIYLVQKQNTENNNIKDEYINLDGTSTGWEKIGSTEINLDGYVTIQALNTALSNYVQSSNIVTILANRTSFSSVENMVATSATDLYDGCLAYVTATKKNYQYDSTNDTDPTLGKWRELQTGGGGGHTIEDVDGTDLTQRDTLQFGEGLLAEDDDTNEKTVVALDPMPSEDMDEVVDIYPTAGELVSIVNAFNRGDIYSTDEKMIGQWIDGKPLYAKTINTGALSNTPNKKVAHSISNFGEIVSMFATYHRTDGKWFQISNVHLTAANKTLQLSVTATNVVIESSSGDYSDVDKSYVTLQYTKTTDTAISIGEATEYSTDEKVVGTWVDGTPVYQKCVAINAFNATSSTQILLSDIDVLVLGIGYIKFSVGQIEIIPNHTPTFWDARIYKTSDNKVTFQLSSENSDKRNIVSGYAILQYTKITT